MKILGIDPGTRVVGWGMLEAGRTGLRCLGYDVIRAGRDALENRLLRVFDGLEAVLREHRPDAVAIENVFVARDPHATIALGEGRGVAILAAARAGRAIFPYTPAEVKKSVTGNGRAGKAQVQRLVRVTLALREIPRPFDAADALAIAICHARRAGLEAATGRALPRGVRLRRRPSARAVFAALARRTEANR
jgi:crossover junction endodeoxyribonuclease RuvC